jgi:hypothetical protein
MVCKIVTLVIGVSNIKRLLLLAWSDDINLIFNMSYSEGSVKGGCRLVVQKYWGSYVAKEIHRQWTKFVYQVQKEYSRAQNFKFTTRLHMTLRIFGHFPSPTNIFPKYLARTFISLHAYFWSSSVPEDVRNVFSIDIACKKLYTVPEALHVQILKLCSVNIPPCDLVVRVSAC